jgi:chitinase
MTNSAPATPSYRLVGYFSSAAAADKRLHVTDSNLPADRLTHLIYAFANVTSDGICASVNADLDSVNFPQLTALKKQYPNLITLISVGGASHSANFPAASATDAARLKLAQSCVSFMKTNGFDGVDIDWEFPGTADKANFTALLTAMRNQLDTQGKTDNRAYLLTIAAPAGRGNLANLDLGAIHPLVDWVNLMTYNYVVASSTTTGLVAPLFAPPDAPASSPASPAESVDSSVGAYLAAGVPAAKVVLGVRFVGTGWQGVPDVNHGLFQPVTPPASGALNVASVDFGDLEATYLPTYPRYWHSQAFVPWLFNASNSGVLISYEDAQSLGIKANYALSKQLGGAMIWDLNADDAQHTLVNALAGIFQAGTGNTYTVTGTVSSPTSASVVGLQVQIVDKNVGGDVALTSTTTDVLGNYRVSVVIAPAALSSRLKSQPDLQARAWSGATFLAASVVKYDASTLEQLDIALPASAVLASEYETLTSSLGMSVSGRLGTLQESADRQDVTYLANKSGWDARAVAMAALADQFSQIAVPTPTPSPTPAPTSTTSPTPAPTPTTSPTPAPSSTATATIPTATATIPTATATIPTATATIPTTTATPVNGPPGPAPTSVAAPPAGIRPEFYYALFRAGLPADQNKLFQTSSGTVQAIWNQAITQGVIPRALAPEVPAAVQSFQALSASHLLTAPPPVGLSTLQQMLAPALTAAADQQTFAGLFTQYRDDWTNFWPAVEKELGAGPAKQLQFTGQLYFLTINNEPLVTALNKAESQNPLTATVDLAARGYYDPAKWTPLIGTSIPPGMPGANADE